MSTVFRTVFDASTVKGGRRRGDCARWYMREEDVFPVTYRVEIAFNDNKLSPMML